MNQGYEGVRDPEMVEVRDECSYGLFKMENIQVKDIRVRYFCESELCASRE